MIILKSLVFDCRLWLHLSARLNNRDIKEMSFWTFHPPCSKNSFKCWKETAYVNWSDKIKNYLAVGICFRSTKCIIYPNSEFCHHLFTLMCHFFMYLFIFNNFKCEKAINKKFTIHVIWRAMHIHVRGGDWVVFEH